MKKRSGAKGWTLIELIIVIVIIGILAVVALPRYLDLRQQAAEAATDGVIGAVRAGIAIYASETLIETGNFTYPDDLTDDEVFDRVLEYSAGDGWSHVGHAYTAPDGRTFTYVPATGRIE